MSAVPDPIVPELPGGGEPLAEIDHALSVMRDALSSQALPRTFSGPAWTELLKRESEFVAEVGFEAIRLARQKRCDVVSASDVAEADGSIRRAGIGSLLFGLQTIGGVIAGAAVSGFVAIQGEKHPEGMLTALTVVGMVLGGALMAFTLGQSWRKNRR